MENTEKKEQWRLHEALQQHAARILALLWFLGSVGIGVCMLLGVTAYGGERLSLFTALQYTVDFANLNDDQLRLYITKLLLGLLYFVYLLRILKNILGEIPHCKQAWNTQKTMSERGSALGELNARFGKICGLSVMYMVWARLLSSACTPNEGVFVAVIGGSVLLATGLMLLAAHKRLPCAYYFLVDTARNALAALVLLMLVHSLQLSVLESLYQGVSYLIENAEDVSSAKEAKALIYLLYEQIIYPVLHVVLLFIALPMIRTILGNVSYWTDGETRKTLVRKCKKIAILGAALIVLYCLIHAVCLGDEIRALFSVALKEFLPLALLGGAGIALLHFSYPEKNPQKSTHCAEAKATDGSTQAEVLSEEQISTAQSTDTAEATEQAP